MFAPLDGAPPKFSETPSRQGFVVRRRIKLDPKPSCLKKYILGCKFFKNVRNRSYHDGIISRLESTSHSIKIVPFPFSQNVIKMIMLFKKNVKYIILIHANSLLVFLLLRTYVKYNLIQRLMLYSVPITTYFFR